MDATATASPIQNVHAASYAVRRVAAFEQQGHATPTPKLATRGAPTTPTDANHPSSRSRARSSPTRRRMYAASV